MRLKIIKMIRAIIFTVVVVWMFLLLGMMFVVSSEVSGGTYWHARSTEDKPMSVYFGDSNAFISETLKRSTSFLQMGNGFSTAKLIVYLVSLAIFIWCLVSFITSIRRKRGLFAAISPIVLLLQIAFCVLRVTGITILSNYITSGTMPTLVMFSYIHVAATIFAVPLNVVLNRFYDSAVKEYGDEVRHKKFRDTSFDETEEPQNVKRRPNEPVMANAAPRKNPNAITTASGQEIVINLSLSDFPGMAGAVPNSGNVRVNPVNQQPNVNRNLINDDDDDEKPASTPSNGPRRMVSNDAAVNDLLAPSTVHAPGSRNSGPRNAGRDALAELDGKNRTAANMNRYRNEPDEEDDKPLNKAVTPSIDLSAFGIDVSTLKSEADVNAAIEKIIAGKAVEEEEEDIPDPSENELDYELQQIEDSDLTDDEVRELKLIIGDPSNMTFIEKFEAADEDLRKKYLMLRQILLSSKEKRLESRITRYFDTYRWHNHIVARITIQGKTIKLFLALNPKDYEGKRISISDESNKLIYHYVPTLIRVRTDMSYKNAKKLIGDMLGKRESDMYEPTAFEFKEKKVDLDYKPEPKPEPQPVVQEAPAVEEAKPAEEVAQPVAEEQATPEAVEAPSESAETKEVEAVEESAPAEEVKEESQEAPAEEEAKPEEPAEEAEEFDVEFDEFGNEIKRDQPKPESEEDEFGEESLEEESAESEEVNEFDEPVEGEENNESDDEGETDDDADSDEESDGDDEESEDGEAPVKKSPFAPRDPNAPVLPRKTYAEKIVESDDPELREHYNELKSFLCSYGVNPRVAKSNETFRYKKELYCKLTIQGKTMKVFLALDPSDYFQTKIPVKDMSAKSAYAQVPCLIKVRSALSLKRAKQLIEDMMAKKGLLQKQIQNLDYVELLEIGLHHESKY